MPSPKEPLVTTSVFAKYVIAAASFLVGHSLQEAMNMNPDVWWGYAVILIVVAVLGVASWALLDPNEALKEFGAQLAIGVCVALATGFLGFLLGVGWGLIAATVLVLLSVAVFLVGRKRRATANP